MKRHIRIGNYVNELTEGEGYLFLENIIPNDLIDSINTKLDTLYPVRASSADKHYAEKSDIKNLPDISVWWSQMVMDWPEAQAINDLLIGHISKELDNTHWYSSDIVTINGDSKWVNPHVDTPHRFKEWNYDERLLGVQCIVSLQDTTSEQGTTGFVPRSYVQDWDIDMCYDGAYNKYFYDCCEQKHMPKGSVLMYNCRLLHSSMPNYLPEPRPMLLLNYLNGDIVEDVKKIDNIWSSNG
jgi:ectoine hydroxylase-related dioxygenase (phytanoyl-CoA dioxygenase family)